MAFPPAPGGFTGIFVIHWDGRVFAYVNSCPHIGTPLDWAPNRFLSADGTRIVCATHGAEFGIADGVCYRGPCMGEKLESVPVEIRDGIIHVPVNAGL
jgi:nitrite reductase/ring-hydroxylating ferredoxin subunit